MADASIIRATTKNCIAFQEAAAGAYKEANMWNDGRDTYAPRVIHNQRCAAEYAREARERLWQLVGY